MKIAIIGNMNNNGFSLMRYFRDLGVDAHLLMYADDASGGNSHFELESDTWKIEQWLPYIHKLDVENKSHTIFGFSARGRRSLPKRRIRKQLAGYEFYIGSGVAPALFARLGWSLDIFYPYSIGIEFYGGVEFVRSIKKSIFKMPFRLYTRRRQAEGIRNTRICLNAEMGLSRDSFNSIGKSFERLAVPMVYNGERVAAFDMPPRIRKLEKSFGGFLFKVFCHARHVWVRPPDMSDAEWLHLNKNTDWLVRGFANFLKLYPGSRAVLILVSYGPDAAASRRLCHEIGIEEHVCWLPIMARKEIMLLLDYCDVGVGEFYVTHGTIWGGTGWEVLASGRPLLQSVNFTKRTFQETFGHELPPILDVKSVAAVTSHLSFLHEHEEKRTEIGWASRSWFDRYNGVSLAKRWLICLKEKRFNE